MFKCLICPQNRRYVGPEGPWDAQLVLIGESPGAKENELGRPFVGRSGDLLNETLMSLGLDRAECLVTNLQKCQPVGKFTFAQAEVCAKTYLRREMARLTRPKVVAVTFGGNATAGVMEFIFGMTPAGLRTVVGQTIEREIFGRKFTLMPCNHPAGILRRMSLKPMFIGQLRKVKEVLEDNWY